MSHHPDQQGTTQVEDRTTKGTAGTGGVVGLFGLIAGIAAIADWFPVMMGITAVVLGLIALMTGVGAWKRAKDQTGTAAGTPGTNLSIGSLAAAVAAIALGLTGVFWTAQVTTADDGVDQVEQEVDELGDEIDPDS
jgi:hypothetical protein